MFGQDEEEGKKRAVVIPRFSLNFHSYINTYCIPCASDTIATVLGTKGIVIVNLESSRSDANGSCRYRKGPYCGKPCRNCEKFSS